MRGRYIVLVVIMLLVALQVSAKGQANRIVLTGPTIDGEMVLTQQPLTSALSMGSLEDFLTGEIDEPIEKGDTYYDLERQFEVSANQIATIDRVRFYPSEGSQPGYVNYVGMENGWTEYDGEWFLAKPESVAAFKTIFNPNAQPYLMLMPDDSRLLMVDPASLETLTDIQVFDFETRIDEVIDGPDAGTLYVNTHDAGFTQHYRVSMSDQTVCWAEVIPPVAGQPAGLMWLAGMTAKTLSDDMQGTWLEPIAEVHSDRTALLHHPLGRYHNYDYGAEDRGEIPGGILIYSYDGKQVLLDQWQADKGFAQVIAGDGVLFALEAPRGEERVELYALDATTGDILESRTLDSGRWHIGYGILDISGVEARTHLRFADGCQYASWEVPQIWRIPQSLVASS